MTETQALHREDCGSQLECAKEEFRGVCFWKVPGGRRCLGQTAACSPQDAHLQSPLTSALPFKLIFKWLANQSDSLALLSNWLHLLGAALQAAAVS